MTEALSVGKPLLAPNNFLMTGKEKVLFSSGCPTLNSGHHLAIIMGDEGNTDRGGVQRMILDVLITTTTIIIAANTF